MSLEPEGHRTSMKVLSTLKVDDPIEVLYLDHFTSDDQENSKEIAQNIAKNAWSVRTIGYFQGVVGAYLKLTTEPTTGEEAMSEVEGERTTYSGVLTSAIIGLWKLIRETNKP